MTGVDDYIAGFPVAVLTPELEQQLAPYRAAKDGLNVDCTKPVPYDLIERVEAVLMSRTVTPHYFRQKLR